MDNSLSDRITTLEELVSFQQKTIDDLDLSLQQAFTRMSELELLLHHTRQKLDDFREEMRLRDENSGDSQPA